MPFVCLFLLVLSLLWALEGFQEIELCKGPSVGVCGCSGMNYKFPEFVCEIWCVCASS